MMRVLLKKRLDTMNTIAKIDTMILKKINAKKITVVLISERGKKRNA